ncbi:MAG TPA: hypothetical protein VFB90_04665 [Dehalococcoidia bacterium]|nr:hypothetical protein [Dehalococcoidia bacterium]
MIFGGKGESKTDVMDKEEKAEKAVEPNKEGYEGIHPGAQRGSARHGDIAFFIVQREGEGAPKTFSCQTEQEAQIFLETLLTQGVAAEAIDLYRANKAAFNVNFKPIVDLQ